jgi:MATE family multidrug resistance protein
MIGSDFDDTTLAANQVLLQFLHITAYGMDGFAFAAESLVGQAVGRRDKSALRQSIYVASLWAVALGVGLAVTFWVMGPWIISVMSTDDGVQQTARSYLVYMVLSPIFGVLPWMLDGVFIGASRARDMRNMMAISLVVYLGAVVLLVPMLGNQGLWLSMLISFAARGLTLATRYPSLERSVG